MSKVLCILGMHRSGSSLVSHWFSASGIPMGERLLRADFSNKKGHYEDLDFLEMHKDFLQNKKLDTSGLDLDEIPMLNSEEIQTMRKLLKSRSVNDAWGWKDPRTLLFIQDYVREVEGLHMIILLRDYKSIISSLINRDIIRHKNSNYSGLFGSLKWKSQKAAITETILEKKLDQYLEVTTLYFQQTEWVLKNFDPGKMIIVDHKEVTRIEELAKDKLERWGFNFNFVPFSSVYDPVIKKEGYLMRNDIKDYQPLDDIMNNLYSAI